MEKDVDFLSPYLARLGDLEYLTKKQALQIRNDCIDDFKRIATEKANGILQEFEKCSNELEKVQSTLTRVNRGLLHHVDDTSLHSIVYWNIHVNLLQTEHLSKEDKEQLVENVNETNLKLRALELRLNRHRELVPSRYRNLLKALQQNRRISILYDEWKQDEVNRNAVNNRFLREKGSSIYFIEQCEWRSIDFCTECEFL